MTREEAIADIRDNIKPIVGGKSLDMAIKALEQQPCEDCISREEALKAMCDKCPMYNCVTGCSSYRHIEKMPSVTPSYNSIKTELKPCEDCISRAEAIRVAEQGQIQGFEWQFKKLCALPSVIPKFTDDEIQKMQELEQAQLEKAYELGKTEMQPSEDAISRESVIDIINFEDEWLFDANSHNADTKIAFSTIKSKISEMPSVTPKASEQQPSREWKEIYAESEGSNSWIEFKCPHCGYSFGMESGEYDWHYGDEIPWKYCPICGGSAEHKPYKAESEDEK